LDSPDVSKEANAARRRVYRIEANAARCRVYWFVGEKNHGDTEVAERKKERRRAKEERSFENQISLHPSPLTFCLLVSAYSVPPW
jgi:hypothetical protein